MCYALYIGTDISCKTSKWSAHDPKFYIEDLQEKDKNVVHQFSKPYIYNAGSWRGCGCGFFAEPEWTESENHYEEIENTTKCISDFVAFLNRILQKSDGIELFVCWEGDQSKRPERKLEVIAGDLLGHSLPIKELDFVIIKKKKLSKGTHRPNKPDDFWSG